MVVTNNSGSSRYKSRPNSYLQGLESIFDFGGTLAIREIDASMQSIEESRWEQSANIEMYFRTALRKFDDTHPLKEMKRPSESYWTESAAIPKILVEYERSYPGAAEIVLEMAQVEQRRFLEKRGESIGLVRKQSFAGLAAGLFIASLTILCGSYCVVQGHDWAGAVICSGTLLGLVGLFVREQIDQEKFQKKDGGDNTPPAKTRGTDS